MNKFHLALPAIALGLVGVTAHANTNYYQAGALCQKADGSTGSLYVDSYGSIQSSSSTTPLTVVCPTAQFESSTQDAETVEVYYNESNGGSDVDDRFYCAVTRQTTTGSIGLSAYRWTCNTAGGCTTAQSTETPGNGTLTWSNVFSSTAGIVHIGPACVMCESSPAVCTLRGYRVEVVGS